MRNLVDLLHEPKRFSSWLCRMHQSSPHAPLVASDARARPDFAPATTIEGQIVHVTQRSDEFLAVGVGPATTDAFDAIGPTGTTVPRSGSGGDLALAPLDEGVEGFRNR